MSLSQAWLEMKEWMSKYAGDSPLFLILAIIAFVYLLIVNRFVRKSIIIPLLLMIPVLINPILYKYIYVDTRYWRLFWIFPETVLIGWAVADLSTRFRFQLVKSLGLIIIAGLIILFGKYAFSPETKIPGNFTIAENLYKVNASVKENCDVILADNPHPKCIIQAGATETRQYSGDIIQLYGRDVEGFYIEPSQKALEVDSRWHKDLKDLEYMLTVAEEDDYTHICVRTREGLNDMAAAHGFSVLSENSNWTIYRRNE